MRLTSKSSGKMISRAKSLTNRCQSPKGREQYLTPTYKLMLKFQTLDSFLNEQLRISKRNYRQSQANITVAGIIQSEGKE